MKGAFQAKTIVQGKAWRGEGSAGSGRVSREQFSQAEREPEREAAASTGKAWDGRQELAGSPRRLTASLCPSVARPSLRRGSGRC